MRTIYVKKTKDIFHQHNVQLSAEMMNMLDEHIARSLTNMAKRCKEGNVKRLTPDLFWVALRGMM